MTDFKPILCLDFDGVIHAYTSGWKGADVIPDAAVPGAMDFIERAVRRFTVAIYSSRSGQHNGILAMRHWVELNLRRCFEEKLADEVMALITWPTEKPPALVTIDDRAICFTGQWPSLDELAAFQPWNKRAAIAVAAAPEGELRAKLRAITASLRNREWADDLGETDPDVLDLRERIAELVGRANLAPPPQPAQAEEDAYVIERMGKLLAEIAIIVNGPEPPLTRWSYHDLPAKVRQIKERSDSSLGPEVARVVYEQVSEGTWRWYVNWIDNNLPNGTLLFAKRPAVESEAQGG